MVDFVLMKWLVVLSAFLTGCSVFQPHEEWRPRDTALEVGFQVLNVIDARSTQQIAASPYEELTTVTRAVLGPKPDPGETAVYFATIGLSHYLISRALPPKWRKWFQAGTIVYSGVLIERNCGDLDLC